MSETAIGAGVGAAETAATAVGRVSAERRGVVPHGRVLPAGREREERRGPEGQPPPARAAPGDHRAIQRRTRSSRYGKNGFQEIRRKLPGETVSTPFSPRGATTPRWIPPPCPASGVPP